MKSEISCKGLGREYTGLQHQVRYRQGRHSLHTVSFTLWDLNLLYPYRTGIHIMSCVYFERSGVIITLVFYWKVQSTTSNIIWWVTIAVVVEHIHEVFVLQAYSRWSAEKCILRLLVSWRVFLLVRVWNALPFWRLIIMTNLSFS